MNILYYSVHAILEDDEVRLFQSMGHNVCCLGVNGPGGVSQPYRPAIEWNKEEVALYRLLDTMGGRHQIGDVYVPPGFVENFDLTVVMHDPNFIASFWIELSIRPVIWRTIGQAIDNIDIALKPYRQNGLYVVRYATSEDYITGGLGCDALIRFAKNRKQYCDWTGLNGKSISFISNYEQRYPVDFSEYKQILDGIPLILGGGGNAHISLDGNVGLVSQDIQVKLLRESRVYLYASGLGIPYTLNFIEAWMTGIPVVLYAPHDRTGRYFEIDRLITDGVDGFVCRDMTTARRRISELLSDDQLATSISTAGRAAAIYYFDSDRIGAKWTELFEMVTAAAHQRQAPKSLETAAQREHSAAT